MAHTASIDSGAAAEPANAFPLFWLFAVLLLILNLGQNFGFGNVNAVEKAAFLGAGVLYLHGKQIDRTARTGLCIVLLPVFLFGALTSFAAFAWSRVLLSTFALLSLILYFLAAAAYASAVASG